MPYALVYKLAKGVWDKHGPSERNFDSSCSLRGSVEVGFHALSFNDLVPSALGHQPPNLPLYNWLAAVRCSRL